MYTNLCFNTPLPAPDQSFRSGIESLLHKLDQGFVSLISLHLRDFICIFCMSTLNVKLLHTPRNQLLSQMVSFLTSGCGGEIQLPFLVVIVALGIQSIAEKNMVMRI